MRTKVQQNILRLLAICILVAVGSSIKSLAKNALSKYTEEKPLTIVADWDFPPYDYRDIHGNPAGFHVDVISTMLDDLEIPYTYVMKEWNHAFGLFNQHKADITIMPNISKPKDTIYSSQAKLSTYKVVVAYKKGTPPINTIKELMATNSVMFKEDDYSCIKVMELGYKIDNSQYITPRKAMNNIANGKIKYFVWGEAPIKWLIRQMNMNDIETCELDIQATHIRFISHDKELIKALDDRFIRLDQAGVINKMYNKWFHPEIAENDASYSSLYIIIAIVIIIIIAIILNRLLANKLKEKIQLYSERNKIMTRALDESKKNVVKYDIKTKVLTNIHGNFISGKELTYNEYIGKIHPDDRKKAVDYIDQIISSKHTENIEISYRWNMGTENEPDWHILLDQSILELDNKNRPINIITTFMDITEERQKELEVSELLEKYSSLLDLSLVGVALYDYKGKLLETNKRMQKLFDFKHPLDEFYYNTSLFDLPLIDYRLNHEQAETMHFCTIRNLILKRNIRKKLEIKIRPIKDEKGIPVYLIVTAQDISEEYELHKKHERDEYKIRKINKRLIHYQNELRYLMQQSNMRVWRSSFDSQKIIFLKDLDETDFTTSFKEFISNTQGEEYKTLATKLIGMQKEFFGSYKAILPIMNLSEKDDTVHWYSINSITEYDNNGNATGCFGLIRDVTELIRSQEKLKEETIRANNSKHQKSVFLANMTHEIRTPLNAIVGFCDLLQSVESPEDRKEFIRIIRNNCNMLLHLINDILDISTIDESGLSIVQTEYDMSTSFDDICATLSQQIINPEVEFIKENPYSSLVIIMDKNRIEQIITNFVTNAIKHTQKGHIRVGYRMEDNGIYIFCEDTGRGIPKDKCASVFERFVKLDDFVQGTGLGLSICKAITEACNGRIGVDSDTNMGATFWFWFPCEIIKKQE